MNAIPALIWDLDGTLIDSYKMIVPSLRQFYEEQGLSLSQEEIRQAVLQTSIQSFSAGIEAQTGISLTAGDARYREIRLAMERQVLPMPHALELLEILAGRGVKSYLFTHRGVTTEAMLQQTGLDRAFEEVLTAVSGFPRKPAPDALNYLVEKHRLDRSRTFYVGDRPLDMDCARNAGLRGILLATPDCPVTAPADYVITDLLELLELPEFRQSPTPADTPKGCPR